ncbi:DUF2058 domain-containing protein [Marinobacterium lutimaris]|uniref:Nucleoprotein/polynucleotide-associated enzyme n=1 Tax=Marinobacterium lutimaris TaxID=568106 RepID=A0A1H5Z8D4_9GAMM|nr:DUF2058 domain-containing protein [Marinobacterium lutimaris]SEG32789.1 hypothetical protein SAMN05444390_1012070 [Marinobacterium lutimaris]
MAISLQDQLLKAGVANKQQAKKAKQAKKQQKKSNAPDESVKQQAELEAARKAKAEKDRELNRQRQEAQGQKAALAEVRQLIEQHRVALPKNGETKYNFVYESKIKSLWIDASLLNQLARGQLRVAVLGEGFNLIPREIVERIEQRLPGTVLPMPEQDKPDEDDPYADYQIPDDLMW